MSSRFLSHTHFHSIRNHITTEPHKSAYENLLAAANTALNHPPLSLRDNGGSPHFRQDAVYLSGKDGERNPASNMKSGELARKLSNSTLNLALAYRFTAVSEYAEKALELIHAWTINQNTLMFPEGRMADAWTPGALYGGDIILFGSFHDFFLACYLLVDYPAWNLPSLAAVKRWVKAMLDPQRDLMFFQGREMYNNWEDARLLYLAKGALFLDDLDLLLAVFDRWRQILPMKMTDQGELPRETMRTRSMHYTLFALDSAAQIAEIAHQHDIDLYDYTVNGKNLKKAIDYAARYLLHMDQWPHPMIESLSDDRGHLALFELAHAHWHDPAYLQILTAHNARALAANHATLLYAGNESTPSKL